ncbi:MAG: Ig-like domain-containing protein, partial [Thermoplasmata archaeon]|nr:Ig-like domain-containing protein [Thermoplasmata archaeon]
GDRVGGLVGLNAGPVSNCSATGNVTSTGSDNVGGLIGDNSGSVDNCQSYSLVTNNGNRTGGLIGFSNGPVSNSTSFGVVSNPKTGSANIESTGGLIGEQGGSTVSSCEAYSNVTGCKFYTGGLVGLSNIGTTITDCSAYGNVNSIGGYVGGVVGRNQGTILESNAYGDIAGTGWTAGFVGDNTGSAIVQNSSAFGDVTGNGLNGGFAGQNTGLIERSFSMGSVTGDDKAGGFVGQNGNSVQDGDITDCYSQGDVTGDDAVGGFAGNTTYTGSTLTNVYSTGFVTGNTNVGGLVGSSYASTVTDSHWDTDTSGQWSSAGGTGQYDDEMMQQATFANWDFTNIWGIHDANTYPFLLPFGVPAEPEADMEITLSDSADPAIVGSGFSYILTLTNHGLGNAANVHVNMTLPAEVTFVSANQTVNVNGRYITADIPAFENEEIGSVRIDVTLDSYSATPINCTANVTSTTFDPGVFDNETYELTEVNRAPIAVNDAETLDEDSGASTIYVLKNDTDADNDALTITNVTQPNNGTVIIIEVGKNLTYEPDTDWNGINSFTYTISDGRGGIATATVTITILPVDDASVAVDDAYNVIEDSGATTFDVLANDYDVEGDAISISTAIQPAHGSISIATNGLSIDYTPDAGFVGTDSFNYTISGGSEATVTVTVTNINDAPVITTTDVTTAMEAVLYSVDYNATDAVLDTLTWTLTTNASWLSIVAVDGVLSGTPTGAGIYWVNVTVADGNTGVDWTNFTLTVAAAPNTAPVISTTTAPDGTEGQLYSLQINATDADGDILTWSLTTNATWLSINTTGELSGTPTSAGAFWVNVLVDDGNGGTDSANLTLTVTSSVVVVDTDGDGVPDSEDAFPTDPAASLDADNDGYPDAWNAGCTADDSTTGLILDPDPTTPATLGDDDQRYDYTWMLIILVLIIGGVIGAVWWFKPKGPKPVPNEILEPEAPIEESSGPDDSASVNTPDNELEELKL